MVHGKVNDTIELLQGKSTTMSLVSEEATPEQLQALLKEQKEASSKLQQQVESQKIRNALETERLQQEQWELALTRLKEEREQILSQHEENMGKLRRMTPEAARTPSHAVAWPQDQLNTHESRDSSTGTSEKTQLVEDLKKQQEELQRRIDDALSTGNATQQPNVMGTQPDIIGTLRKALEDRNKPKSEQELLLEQIRMALAPKEADKDPNKALLKALLTTQNKTTGASGTTTLKPELLHRLTGDTKFSMAEWLATLNKQEEGESEAIKLLDDSDCRAECKHSKNKSGMLDKSTTNIRHKEVWPQKNLGEDWAEEEMEFKQLKFEHLVAGETRTIETCSEPAQILGRLRLLRRIAYLKLLGIEWPLLRKMYAAILSSIETREYSWESNFDRFESIFYRRVITDRTTDRDHRQQDGRKRFCRDYNKPEGCSRNSPHTVWFGSGPVATKRMVYHSCAACLIRDKTPREHPEGHADCPHRH